MRRLAMLFILFVISSVPAAKAAEPMPTPGYAPQVVAELVSPMDTLSCAHLKHRYKIQMDSAYSMEAVMGKYTDFLGGAAAEPADHDNYYNNLVDALDFLENRNHLKFDSLAAQSVLDVQWQIPQSEIKSLVPFRPQILGVLGAARHTASNLQFQFQSPLVKLQRSSKDWTLSAVVRPLDICLAEKLDLIFYADCEIDNTKFDGCLPGDYCPELQPVVLWMSCKRQATVALSLKELQETLGQRPGKMKRGGGK